MEVSMTFSEPRVRKSPELKRTPYDDFLAPYQRLMVTSGLLYTEDARNPFGITVSKVLHFLFLLVMWFNVIRYFGAYYFGEPFDIPLVFKFIVHIYYLWAACGALAGSKLTKVQRVLFKEWVDYQNSHNVVYSDGEQCDQRRRVRVVLVATLCLGFSGVILYVGLSFDVLMRNTFQALLLPFYDRCWYDTVNYGVLVTAILLNLVTLGPIQVQLGYILLLVLGLRDEFARYNTEFAAQIVTDAAKRRRFAGDLECWRHRHAEIVRLVKILDEDLGLYVLVIFTSNIPICCFLIFIVVMGQYELVANRLRVWALILPVMVASTSIMFIITYCGTKLNNAAVACKHELYSLYLAGEEWTNNRHQQYRVFEKRLTEGHIGISGWKLFDINKTTVKMVVLLLAGYSLILLKFGSSSTQPLFICSPHNDTNGVHS